MNKIGFCILLISWISPLIHGQCALSLKVVVKDFHHDDPLEYATIFIKEANKEAFTNKDGEANIQNLCPGDYHISIFHIGCPTTQIFIQLTSDTILPIFLEHHDEMLAEVEVLERSQYAQAGKMASTLHRDQIFESASHQLSDIVQRIPGVSMIKTGPTVSKPIINGMVGQRLTIVNQGFPQEGQQWGLDHAPEIDGSTADKITVLQGPASIRYGMNAMGGVIIIEPNIPSTDPHVHGDASIIAQSNGRLIGTSLRLKQSTKTFAWNGYGSFSYSGDRHTPKYMLTNTGQRIASGGINIVRQRAKTIDKFSYGYYRGVQGILRGSHVGNLTDLSAALTREEPFFTKPSFSYRLEAPRQWVAHHTLNAQRSWDLSSSSNFVMNIGSQLNQRQEFDVRRSNRSEIPALSMNLFNLFGEAIWKHKSKQRKEEFTTGIQYKYTYNANNSDTGILPLIPDYVQQSTGIFATFFHKFSQKSQIEFGSRYDLRWVNTGIIDKQNIVFKKYIFNNSAAALGYRYSSDKMQWFSEIAWHSRSPDISELHSNGLHQGVSGIEVGNPNLPSEKMGRVSQSFQTEINEHIHFQLMAHYSYIRDFIYLRPTSESRLTIRGAFPVYEYTNIDAVMAGLNGQLVYEHSQWQGILSSQYTQGTNIETYKGLVRIPPLQSKAIIQYTTKKIGRLQELKLGLETVLVSEQHRIDPADDFLLPPSGYWLQHGYIRTKFNARSGRTVDMFFRIDNIWNQSYRDYLNRWRYFADEVGLNATLNVKINF